MNETGAGALVRGGGPPRFTPQSVTDENAYRRERHRVRENGYVLDDGEYLADIIAETRKSATRLRAVIDRDR